MKTFGIWDEIVHDSPDQQKRIESSKKKECTPLQLNEEDGVFKGSKKNYFTTLSSCTCVDFGMRKLPCKHMYRLAFELNVFGSENVCDVDTKLVERKRIEDVMPIIDSLSEEEQKKYKDFAYQCGKNNEKSSSGIKIEKTLADKFIRLELAIDVSTIELYLSKLNKQQLSQLFPENMSIPKQKKDMVLELQKLISLNDYEPNIIDRYLLLPASIETLAYSIHKKICSRYPEPRLYLDEKCDLIRL